MIGQTNVYVVTDLAGPSVAGRRRAVIPIDDDGKQRLALTDEEARFELLTGALVADGQPLPPIPVRARILTSDSLVISRNGFTEEVQVSDLLALLGLGSQPQPVVDVVPSGLDLSRPLTTNTLSNI